MTCNEICQNCPTSPECGQLKQALVVLRSYVDQATLSGKDTDIYYKALLLLQQKRWYYPHNISKCTFENSRAEINKVTNLLIESRGSN